MSRHFAPLSPFQYLIHQWVALLLVMLVFLRRLVLVMLLLRMVLELMIEVAFPPVNVVGLGSHSVGSHFHTGAEIGRGSGRRQTISSAALFSQPRNFVLLLLLTMMLAAVGRRGRGGGRRCCATANIVITGTGSGRRVEVVQQRAKGHSTDIQNRAAGCEQRVDYHMRFS